jgi:AcrR family transcriptional regulator
MPRFAIGSRPRYGREVSHPPFHHGNLRAELLERAEGVLRARGAAQLSLRQLARDAGVSHGAPRSHFIDRGALLDALAELGFDRLVEAINAAVRTLPSEAEKPARLRVAGKASLDFAADNPALLDVMTAAKAGGPSPAVHDAAARLFATMSALVADVVAPHIQDAEDIRRLTTLLSATVQGIASMVGSGRIPAALGDVILDDAIRVFVAGTLGGQPRV